MRVPRLPDQRRSLAVLSAISALTLVLTLVSGLFAVVLRSVASDVNTVDITGQLGDRPDIPAAPTGPIDILLMGSDTRAGQGRKYGQQGYYVTAHSDTTMLIHLYEDRKRALVVSIPRDTIVKIPECVDESGNIKKPTTNRFNFAFSQGGAACTVKTVESLTGITVEHYVVVNFRGFKSVVDALGGVEVCIPEDVDDPKSKLTISAGLQNLDGETALAYVRTRYGLGDGGDISRIERQQDFLKSMVRKITSSQVLLDPIRLFRTLSEIAKSLTTNPELGSPENMTSLARSIAGMSPSKIRFVTAPIVTNPADPNTVLFSKFESAELWNALINDLGYKEPAEIDPSLKPEVAVKTVRVSVLNASGINGAAAAAGKALRAEGFNVIRERTAEIDIAQTVIEAPELLMAEARTLQKALGTKVEIIKIDADIDFIKLRVGQNSVVVSGYPKEVVKDSTWKEPEPTGADQKSECVIN